MKIFPFGTGSVIVRFEGLIPDKDMFVDFSDSKIVIDLKKAVDSVKASYCLHVAFNVQDTAVGCNGHVHILKVLK